MKVKPHLVSKINLKLKPVPIMNKYIKTIHDSKPTNITKEKRKQQRKRDYRQHKTTKHNYQDKEATREATKEAKTKNEGSNE